MRGLFLLLCMVLSLAAPRPAAAASWTDCKADTTAERKVAACTAMIASGPRKDRHIAYNNRCHAYNQLKQYDRAIPDCNEAIRISPGYALAHSNRGLAHRAKGDHQRAIADYNQAIRLNPRHAVAYNNRGYAYLLSGEYDRAITDLDQAIRLDSLYVTAYLNRAEAHHKRQDYDRAIADAEQAQRLDPQSHLPHQYRGVALADKGDLNNALAAADEAVRLKPDTASVYTARSHVYSRKRDWDRAQAEAEQAIRLDPGFATGYNNRGFALSGKGQWDLAIASYDTAIRLHPAYAVAYSNRGAAYSGKGDYARAHVDYDVAIGLNPQFARAYFNRAETYALMGDGQRALASYDRALRLNPRMAEATEGRRTALERLGADPSRGDPVIAAALDQRARMPGDGRRVALVIGNGDYRNVSALPNPKRDAAAVAASLRMLGFDVVESYDLDADAMRRVLGAFEDKADGADWALVYFAGHGMEMDGRNWLIPVDAALSRSTDVADETVELDGVLNRMRAARRLRMVILDACRNNPFTNRMTMTGGRTRSMQRGLADIEPEHGEVVFYAARHGTTAEDGASEHSPFARALLKYLGEDGLEIGLFFRKVTSEVLASTSPKQEPFVYGRIPAENFYFKPPQLQGTAER